MEKGHQKKVLTPGYNARRNMFVTLSWPKKSKRNWFIFNTYAKRRSREFKLHLSNVMQYARARSQKGHPLCRPCTVPQDQEREKVHPGTSYAQGEDAPKEGAKPQSRGEEGEQALEVSCLYQPFLL
jgi:hypothetical protein